MAYVSDRVHALIEDIVDNAMAGDGNDLAALLGDYAGANTAICTELARLALTDGCFVDTRRNLLWNALATHCGDALQAMADGEEVAELRRLDSEGLLTRAGGVNLSLATTRSGRMGREA